MDNYMIIVIFNNDSAPMVISGEEKLIKAYYKKGLYGDKIYLYERLEGTLLFTKIGEKEGL